MQYIQHHYSSNFLYHQYNKSYLKVHHFPMQLPNYYHKQKFQNDFPNIGHSYHKITYRLLLVLGLQMINPGSASYQQTMYVRGTLCKPLLVIQLKDFWSQPKSHYLPMYHFPNEREKQRKVKYKSYPINQHLPDHSLPEFQFLTGYLIHLISILFFLSDQYPNQYVNWLWSIGPVQNIHHSYKDWQ